MPAWSVMGQTVPMLDADHFVVLVPTPVVHLMPPVAPLKALDLDLELGDG